MGSELAKPIHVLPTYEWSLQLWGAGTKEGMTHIFLLECYASNCPDSKEPRLLTTSLDVVFFFFKGHEALVITMTVNQTNMALKLDFHRLKFVPFAHQQRRTFEPVQASSSQT